jgi:hypothetical protein
MLNAGLWEKLMIQDKLDKALLSLSHGK